ncbi:DUF4328 domain-containing protein [Gordonia mangrovi]|uniref:DUF4328 domain-containing protein n=1 Tax=Gordonia mangrovi TaxID=2665643 RepID=UPI0021ACD1BD|nr:DUF4328 domain-containing protein [Gordonia mangrovi]UVF80258.1 DUF4328 domain-containing protein [Gordonia mangrovi]
MSGPRSGRLYRSRHVRWVARRPPEAIPLRRRPELAAPPRYIPRYVYIPQWGLRDAPVAPDAATSRAAVLSAALTRALHVLAAALGLAAIAHLLRYGLLIVNRSTPVPAWTDLVTSTLVIFGGLLALGCFVYTTVVFARWVMAMRTEAYRGADRRDPRARWQILLLAAVPLVNVVGVAVLLHEAANVRADLDRDRTRRRLTRMWVAWTIVNVLAVAAIVTRVVATLSGSIQTGANGLVAVTVSAACSAVFARWLAGRLEATFATAQHDPVPSRRWVVAA